MFALKCRQTVAAVGVAIVLSGGAVVVANAQATPTPAGAQATAGEHHKRSGGMLAVAAQAIGVTPQQLHEELPGKSLTQVAEAHGKNATDVANALKQAASARIDRAMTRIVPATTTSGVPHTPPVGG